MANNIPRVGRGSYPIFLFERLDETPKKFSLLQFPVHLPEQSSLRKRKVVVVDSDDVARGEPALKRARSSPEELRSLTRRKFAFTSNHTMSRTRDADHAAAQEEFRDRIEDHASRRVLIFYYLLVIYYKEDVKIEGDRTSHQYGVAKSEGHHAAHSSILPNVKDNFVDVLIEAIEENGITPSIEEKLRRIGFDREELILLREPRRQRDLLDALKKDESLSQRAISDESYLYKTMNSTVELAREVNYFDTLIEGVIREQAIDILNRTSSEHLHPYEGLKIFIRNMQEFFSKSGPQIQRKRELLPDLLKAEQECAEFEQQFRSTPTEESFVAYINSLVSVKEAHRKLNDLNSFSPGIPERPPLKTHKSILKVAHDIYITEKRRVVGFQSLSQLKGYAGVLKQLFERRKNFGNIPFAILERVLEADAVAKASGALKEFLLKCSQGDLMLAKGVEPTIILTFLGEIEPWESGSLDEPYQRLEMADMILKVQKESTVLPKYEMLSGKVQDDVRVGLTDEELLMQKSAIIEYV